MRCGKIESIPLIISTHSISIIFQYTIDIIFHPEYQPKKKSTFPYALASSN
jgi:hypothetical protein